MIRVFVAEDHPIVVDALKVLISSQPDMVWVGSDPKGMSVVARCTQEIWDVLILDLYLADCFGSEVLAQVKAHQPRLPVIVFSRHREDLFAVRLLKEGAMSFLHKGSPSSEILIAIRKAAEGKRHLTPNVAELVLQGEQDPEAPPHVRLSSREYQVFLRLVQGRTSKSICAELNLGKSTVSTYVSIIKRKIEVESVADMVAYAMKWSLLE